MTEMPIEERDATEVEVRTALKGVRLVFELGFPAALVQRANDVLMSAGRLLMEDGRLRYPACFVLTVVNLAKDRRDRTFWSADALEPLRKKLRMTPQQLAETTRRTMVDLRMETFDDLVEKENALRNMTPVTMHSGIPVNNMADLVHLIEAAARRHRYSPDEQIEYWASSPNGFAGLWAAPRRLFLRGGAIALDLLDQVNEALRNPAAPEVSGLPEHLVRAISEVTRGRHVFAAGPRGRGSAGVNAVISIDPASPLGPVLNLPRVAEDTVSRWRVTGSSAGDVPASRESDLTLRLLPARDYEVSGLSPSGMVLSSRIFRTYGGLPVVLFDGLTGRMLQQSGRRVETENLTVIALVHRKVDLTGVEEDIALRVECSGAWEGWTVRTLRLGAVRSLTAVDTARAEDTEDFVFVRAVSRPALVHSRRPRAVLESLLGEVFVAAPALRLDIGGADPGLVTVIVESDTDFAEVSLADLDCVDGFFDLSGLFDGNGSYTVRVEGPIGLRMPSQRVLLLEGLEAEQDPPLGVPGQPLSIEMSLGDWSDSFPIAALANTGTAVVEGFELRLHAERIEWALSLGAGEPAVLGSNEFTFTVAEASSDEGAYLHLRSSVPCELDVEMMDGLSLVHSETVRIQGVRRSLSMKEFLKHAGGHGTEMHTVMARIQGSPPFPIGRITSEYVVSLAADVAEGDDSVELRFEENKPFDNRVVRMWSLDRPWEPSWAVRVPGVHRERFTVRMPPGHRSGRYRLWMRIENLDGASPRRPKSGTRGVVDVEVTSGRGLDDSDPVDRILKAVSVNDPNLVLPGDVESHGHVLVALLSVNIEDEGGAGLTGRTASMVYRLLEKDSSNIIRHVATALDRDVVEEEWATHVSLALLPVLFEAEDRSDLSVEEDYSELVWSRLPLIAAAVEPWTEGLTALHKWNEKLGWPHVTAAEHDDDEHVQEKEVDALRLVKKRRVLTDRFDMDMRLVCNLPDGPRPRSEIESMLDIVIGAQIGSRDGMPLSVDAEWNSVVRSVPGAFVARGAIAAWRGRHEVPVSRAHRYMRDHEFRYLADQYQARSVWMDEPQYKWVFYDIAVLAFSAVDDREDSVSQMRALVDALEFAPRWVEYSVILALSTRPFYTAARRATDESAIVPD